MINIRLFYWPWYISQNPNMSIEPYVYCGVSLYTPHYDIVYELQRWEIDITNDTDHLGLTGQLCIFLLYFTVFHNTALIKTGPNYMYTVIARSTNHSRRRGEQMSPYGTPPPWRLFRKNAELDAKHSGHNKSFYTRKSVYITVKE